MKKANQSIWTRPLRNCFDDAEDLANAPSGGPMKQWLAGVVGAAMPILYGSICLERGYTSLFGTGSRPNPSLTGDAGYWLAVAYIAIGAFLHFHYFWGLSERLGRYSQFAKTLAVLVFLPSFLYAVYRGFF